ncbi:MAG: copper homeostasis protein CutC [Verrucomicrobiota bacterium]
MPLEIAIDSPASAHAAHLGGADRVELCSNLPEGGTTPSIGLIHSVRKIFPRTLMVLIRPRGGDFLFDDDDLSTMLLDIQTAKNAGADGFVLGSLLPNGTVNRDLSARLIDAASPLQITFHRAFDMTRNLPEALEALAQLGVHRILTSGAAPHAFAGIPTIAQLVTQAANRLSILPGGGITESQIPTIIHSTAVTEIHLSARSTRPSQMLFKNLRCHMGDFTKDREYEIKSADLSRIQAARSALSHALSHHLTSP